MVQWFRFVWLLLPVLCLAQPQRPDTLWTRVIGDSLGDYGEDVQIAPDGGFFVSVRGNGTTTEAGRIVKFNAEGEQEWVHMTRFGGYDLITYSLMAMPDFGCIYVGNSGGSGTVTVRLNAAGERMWVHLFPGTGGIYFRWVCPYIYGGCLVLAHNSDVADAMTLICYSDAGEVMWSRVFSMPTVPSGFTATLDGGIAMLIHPTAYHNAIFRISETGDSLWTHSFNVGNSATLTSMCLTADGGFAAAGLYHASEQPMRIGYLIARLDENGTLLSTNRCDYGAAAGSPNSIALAPDSGFYLAGTTSSPNVGWAPDIWLARFSPRGDTLWNWRYRTSSQEELVVVRALPEGGCIAVGSRVVSGTGTDAFLVRMGADSISAALERPAMPDFAFLGNYPNPFNPTTTIEFDLPRPSGLTLSVFDITGRMVKQMYEGSMNAGSHRMLFDGADLPSGIYFAHLTAAGITRTAKMVLLK